MDQDRRTTTEVEPGEHTEQDDGVIVLAGDASDPEDGEDRPEEEIDRPTKLLRIAAMVKGLLQEVEAAELDDAGRQRLAHAHDQSVRALRDVLSDDLLDELDQLAIGGLSDGQAPSAAELRVAQAQLAGWLEGLFHGIQAAMAGQQAQAQRKLLQQQLGGGASRGEQRGRGTGQYL